MLQSAALLATQEARAADQSTIDNGTAGETLMENAGKAVVSIISDYFKPAPVLVLCGNGNNGGDGFIVARLLKERNWPVTLCMLGELDDDKSDAAKARSKWQEIGGKNTPFFSDLLGKHKLVVDAIFGTGLDRVVEGPISDVINDVNNSPLPVISIDIPSGINGDSGAVMGVAMEAMHTVTFTHAKPGHFLLPGKVNTGHLHVQDIGISSDTIIPRHFLNIPSLWNDQLSKLMPTPDCHKYSRGHAIVVGGGLATTGASKLAAMAALRVGSGLVSVACTKEALPAYASSLVSVMTKPYGKLEELEPLLDDKHTTAILIGPGSGVNDITRELTIHMLSHKKPCVIDADAISAFQDNPNPLFSAIKGPTVITPHEGEFSRLFWVKGAKTERAVEAAKESGAVIVLKGNDTVIAAPDGRVAINYNAPVWLATAGAGDVLSGLITGLMAQSIPPFEAACMGTWMHSEAASQFGPGLIAEDLPSFIPDVLRKLYYE
jgi:ADP-dependent NAD(P)H-hydrate dehydratase / NAD(P)H-hydrate epimerase